MRYLMIDEVADMLKLKKSTIYAMTMRKRIPFVKVGKLLRFPEDKILAWLESLTVTPQHRESYRTDRTSQRRRIVSNAARDNDIDQIVKVARREVLGGL